MLLRLPDAWSENRRAGTVDERLVSFVDLAPTILSLAGVAVPEYVHGLNFLTDKRRFVFASRDRIDEVPYRDCPDNRADVPRACRGTNCECTCSVDRARPFADQAPHRYDHATRIRSDVYRSEN